VKKKKKGGKEGKLARSSVRILDRPDPRGVKNFKAGERKGGMGKKGREGGKKRGWCEVPAPSLGAWYL